MRKFFLTFIVLSVATFGTYAQTDVQKAMSEAAKGITEQQEEMVAPPKPKYWKTSCMTNINFVQSSFTNWAKGGYNNYALSTYIDANANWAKDAKSWKNRLQMDYGFLYSEDKPLIQKNKDRILFESTWGHKATKTMNYSAKFTFLSQFTDGYTYGTPSGEDPTKEDWKNARRLKSGLLSPGTASVGVGIDWIPNKWLTVNFAPLTGGFTVVTSEKLRKNYGMERKKEYEDITEYPDEKDENNVYFTTGYYYRPSRFEFGAQLTADAKVKVNDNFNATSHLILFSNYLKKPQNFRVNWDNRFMWKLSKFFSLNLSTTLIYDDTVLIVDEKYPNGRRIAQFSEALQFGFTYTFASK